MNAEVAVVKCPDYEYTNVEKAIRKSIGLVDKDIIPIGKRILLKPNLLSSTKGPEKPVNTHPAIVEVLAKILKEEYACTVYIGDSSGGMSYGETRRAFLISGLDDISKRLGVELVNFENTGVITLKNDKNKIKKEFAVTKFIKEIDFIINLPKLKTHSLVSYTGAVKNMMGVVPGSGKRDMHITAPKTWQMEQCIVDLYSLVIPQLSIMDAVISMDGDGPAAGSPKNSGLILASRDAVALDVVAAQIAGYNPDDLLFIKDAQERNLGVGDINKITVLGEPIESVKIEDFKKPSSRFRDYIINFIPGRLLKAIYFGMTSGMPVIQQVLCRRCNVCYDNCPVSAIKKFSNGRLVIEHEKCIECYCCHEFCPHNAIKIEIPLSVRFMRFGINILRKIYVRIRRR